MMVDKYWSDMLQILTEDENLRVRKSDMVELEKSDIREFFHHLKLFEKRTDERMEQLNKLKK